VASRTKSIKQWIKDQRMWISLITLLLGVLFLVVSMAGLWIPSINKGVIEDFTDSMKDDKNDEDWNWIIFFVAVVAVLFGGGYFIDFIRKKKNFKELMETSSKKAFLEKQDDIEVLAYKLGTPFENMVDEKIAELKIKR